MKTLRVILGDQLSRSVSALRGADPETDFIWMAEVAEETTYVRHHKHKIVLILSAMRHFAAELKREGFTVTYTGLDDPDNAGSFTKELHRAVNKLRPDRIVATEPGEWRVLDMMRGWQEAFNVPVAILADDRFICAIDEFKSWAEDRKSLRMEYFYREMRRKTGWLMDGDDPVGGQWNYDADNRKAIGDDVDIPRPKRFEPDAITREVIDLVNRKFPDHMGLTETFGWAVTREDAKQALDYFVKHLLPQFGEYQDAMKRDEDFLFHSLLSPYINIGLFLPEEVCLAAMKNDAAPVQAVEGFVRQILGWREFVRGVYWLYMPEYKTRNVLEAKTPLPSFYWTGNTDMACMKAAIGSTIRHAYAHHIHRLMITGNFALLAGLDPDEVNDWYLCVYADAFEWVELPNTHGMVLHADGGVVGSKPYAASAAYINRMSNYCKGCRYNHKDAVGDNACPFNFLYWNFIDRNEKKLGANPRMAMPYRNLKRMDAGKRQEMNRLARQFLANLT